MSELIFEFGVLLFLIVLGWAVGTITERRHLADLDERESGNGEFLVTQLKSFPAYAPSELAPQVLFGETVIATDYFKSFMASFWRLFGGEIRSYKSLLERARRESTQRIIEQARQMGYNAICNLRLETADVGGNSSSKKGVAVVCILASATAYHYESSASS